MHVVEEHLEMSLALSVRDDDGDMVSGSAVRRPPQTARLQLRVEGGEFLKARSRYVVHLDPAF